MIIIDDNEFQSVIFLFFSANVSISKTQSLIIFIILFLHFHIIKSTNLINFSLPYTEACIREILRYETLVPSGVAHSAMADTEFSGYSIPKGTLVFTLLGAAMHDPIAWHKPNEFYPERFLDSSGKLCLDKDISVPFGAGKRLCAGETFARNMLFLCTTAILQSFTVRMADGAKPLKYSDNVTGLIRLPKNHWIELTAR